MKRIYSLFLLLGVALMATAQTRSADEALREAQTFLHSSTGIGHRAPVSSTLSLSYTLPRPDKAAPAAYLFQVNDDNGYVLVSAEEHTRTILAYGDEGSFDANNIPANMQVWLQHYAEEIAWASSHGSISRTAADGAPTARVAKKLSGSRINPLLEDIVWNQDAPFWDNCPYDSDGNRSYTGCVATAATQIMRYWKCPEVGSGSHSYEWTRSDGSVRTLSANFNHAYDWDNMLGNYNNGYTEAQGAAVARLMSDMGIAIDMVYSSNGSGTQTELAARALYEYFGYDASLRAVRPDFVGNEAFAEQMLAELQAGRPVLMSGATTRDEGHAFVCDGYDGDGFFHINWGWGGMQNDYFALTALDPAEQGMGGAASGQGFSVDVLGVMGIKPNEGGVGEEQGRLGTLSFELNADDVITLDTEFSLTVERIMPTGVVDYNGGFFGIAIVDANDEVIGWFSYAQLGYLPAGAYYPSRYDFPGVLYGFDYSNGEYRLVPVYTDENGNYLGRVDVGFGSPKEYAFRVNGNTVTFSNEGIDDTNERQEVTLQLLVNDETMGRVTGAGVYYSGDVVEISAEAYNGYEFVEWSDGDTNATRTIEFEKQGSSPRTVTLTATFRKIIDYNIYNLQAYAEGSTIYFTFESEAPYYYVQVYNDETLYAEAVIDYNDVVVSDVPDGEWTVWVAGVEETQSYYIGDGVSTTVTVDMPQEITVELLVNDEEMGTVNGSDIYLSGQTVHISAVPNEGYRFVKWDDDVETAERDLVLEKTSREPRTITLTAIFEADVIEDIEGVTSAARRGVQKYIDKNKVFVKTQRHIFESNGKMVEFVQP